MIFIQSTLIFFTTLASNPSNSYAATTGRRSLLRSSSSSKEEVAPYDNNNNASLSLMRRKLDDMMPPAGYSVRCLDEPDKVYRWTDNELRYYPSGQIASSWNTAWREDLVQIDCTYIPMGSPMSMNFGSLTMSRAADGFSEAEVYSVRCLEEPDKVYRWHEGEIHHYPTSIIASSWDEDWREALVELDCSNILKGAPMSEKNTVDDSSAMVTPSSTQSRDLLQVGGNSNCIAMGPEKNNYCWGHNGSNEMLDGTTAHVYVPKEFPYDTVQHSTGYTSCMIMESSELLCWGSNVFGQVGIGYVTETAIDTPTNVVLDRGVSAIKVMVSSYHHVCVIDSTNRLQCWGWNKHGQLGLGDTTDRYTPATVELAEDVGVIQLALGAFHTCVVDINKSVHCWGYNQYGQIGTGTINSPVTSPTIVALVGGAGAAQLGSGAYHTCAVDINNNVQCWGYNTSGELGIGSNVSHIVTPTIVQLGDGLSGEEESSDVQIAVGGFHNCVLLDGAQNPLKCWGWNGYGEIGDGSKRVRTAPTNVVLSGVEGSITELKAGFHHNCIVVVDNMNKTKPFCWGNNDLGHLGDGTTIQRRTPTPVSIDI